MFNVKGLELKEIPQGVWACQWNGKTVFSFSSKEKCIKFVNTFFSTPYLIEEELGLEVYRVKACFEPDKWIIVSASDREIKAVEYTDSTNGLWKNARNHVLNFVH